jgi:hypothetical protein
MEESIDYTCQKRGPIKNFIWDTTNREMKSVLSVLITILFLKEREANKFLEIRYNTHFCEIEQVPV